MLKELQVLCKSCNACFFFSLQYSSYTGSVICETDNYNHNRYEYYCVTCEEVVVLRVNSTVLYEIIEKNKRYDLVIFPLSSLMI